MKPLSLLLLTLFSSVFLCHAFVEDQGLTKMESFDFVAPGSFIANRGNHTSKFRGTALASGDNPVVWVLDVENQRWFFNHTNNIHYIFSDGSYFIVPGFGNLCFPRPNYNFTTHIQNWSGMDDMGPDYKIQGLGAVNIHTGWVNDHHACDDTKIQVTITTFNRTSNEHRDELPARLQWQAPLKVPAFGLNAIVDQAVILESWQKTDSIPSSYFDVATSYPQCFSAPQNFNTFFGCGGGSRRRFINGRAYSVQDMMEAYLGLRVIHF